MKEHRVYIGERVFDYSLMYVVRVMEFLEDGLVIISKGEYSEENRRNFDLDEHLDDDVYEVPEEYLYKFVPGLVDRREGMPICYEHIKTDDDYPYYSPYLDENLFTCETESLNGIEIA